MCCPECGLDSTLASLHSEAGDYQASNSTLGYSLLGLCHDRSSPGCGTAFFLALPKTLWGT
jgi:hypothetical protein